MADDPESLTDGDLQSEIELVGDLVVAATSSDGPLPQDEIDRLLGVEAVQEGEPGEEVDSGEGVGVGEEPVPDAES